MNIYIYIYLLINFFNINFSNIYIIICGVYTILYNYTNINIIIINIEGTKLKITDFNVSKFYDDEDC